MADQVTLAIDGQGVTVGGEEQTGNTRQLQCDWGRVDAEHYELVLAAAKYWKSLTLGGLLDPHTTTLKVGGSVGFGEGIQLVFVAESKAAHGGGSIRIGNAQVLSRVEDSSWVIKEAIQGWFEHEMQESVKLSDEWVFGDPHPEMR